MANENNLTLEKLKEAIDKVEKIKKDSIRAVLLTHKVREIYQVDYEGVKYILMPYETWIKNEHLFEVGKWAAIGMMAGMLCYEDEELVEKILESVIKWYAEKLRKESTSHIVITPTMV